MTVITRDTIVGNPDFYPRVGYQNLFRDGTVTASSEAASGPRQNAYDGFTYDFWTTTGSTTEWIRTQLGVAAAVDYMAVAAHTLTGCDLTPQYSNDGSSWTNLAASFEAEDDGPIIFEFSPVSATYFRLLIEGATGPVSVGAIHCGQMLTMERGLSTGWRPPSLNEDIKYTNTISEGGQTLGRNIISRGAMAQVQSDPVTWEFARGDWLSFIEVANLYACFFWWAYGDYGEVLYGGMTQRDADFSQVNFVRASFQLEGIIR
jgi:hypothetical protein